MAFYSTPLNYEHSTKKIGLQFCVPEHDPCVYYVVRDAGLAVGAMTTHINDILICGESRIMQKVGA